PPGRNGCIEGTDPVPSDYHPGNIVLPPLSLWHSAVDRFRVAVPMTDQSSPDNATVPPTGRRDEVRAVLARGRKGRAVGRWVLLAALLAAGILAWWLWQRRSVEEPAFRYQTAAARRGTLQETVTATGTLNPVDAVELGAEVTGKLVKVTVDVNDPVQEGQLLAEIDPEQLQARV